MYRLGQMLILVTAVCIASGAFALIGTGDSDTGPLNTVAPLFYNLEANPPEATAGELVTLTFRSSKALGNDPFVLVNGKVAQVADDIKTVAYTCIYEVTEADAPGMALIEITGVDPLGNAGALSDNMTLKILDDTPGLPLRTWPVAAVLLLAAGVLVLWLRPRQTVTVLAIFALCLSATPASAQVEPPVVANVYFVQGPDAELGTKVDIYFDLETSDPCYITVLLSKNGGATFEHPVSAITGDLDELVSGVGYHIVWDIAAEYPNEDIPNARIRVLADDRVYVEHNVSFATDGTSGATFEGDTEQLVGHGENAEPVRANDTASHSFVEWTLDGNFYSAENPLTVENVTEDIELVAVYALNEYSVSFDTDGTPGATLDGDVIQTIAHGADAVAVTANTPLSHSFVGWTLGAGGAQYSTDNPLVVENVTGPMNLVAVYAVNQYPVSFETGGTSGAALEGDISQLVDHGADASPVTAMEPPSHTFMKWTLDGADYSTDNPVVVTTVTEAMTLVAVYAINQYTVNFATDGTPDATLTGDTAQTVDYGANATPVAANNTGSHSFVNWTLDGGEYSTDNPLTATNVTTDMTLVAEYEINVYALNYAPGANGSITGDTNQSVAHGGSGTPVTAEPDPGYFFLAWSDGSSANPRTDTNVEGDVNVTASFSNALPAVVSLTIDGGAADTIHPDVTLDYEATDASHYMVSEYPDFSDTDWVVYDPGATTTTFTLSDGYGVKTMYFKVKNPAGESSAQEGQIERRSSLEYLDLIPVAGGSFERGRPYAWDSAWGTENAFETPVHTVTLSPYLIGKYSVTVQQYCDVLNWAHSQVPSRLFRNTGGDAYTGQNNVFGGGTSRYQIITINSNSNIIFSGGQFVPRTRVGTDGVSYSMGPHAAEFLTWYGAAAFCNWLSEMQGLTPLYDMDAATWPLVAPHTAPGYGYRLPTDAERERAAAWDTEADPAPKHWRYGLRSDSIDNTRANYYNGNPLGLTGNPLSSPVGWYNGINVSPNGNSQTVRSVSPIGAYDMSGGTYEWVQDWYVAYTSDPLTDPAGAATGPDKTARGGSWYNFDHRSRTAVRARATPVSVYFNFGFRIALTPTP